MIRIAKFWLDKGVDGFRLDAAQNIIEEGPGQGYQWDSPGTINWWVEFATSIREEYWDAFLVGEVWSEYKDLGKYYADGKGLHACFDFPLEFAITDLLTNEISVDSFSRVVQEKYAAGTPSTFYAPFLSNHDQVRYLTALGGDMEKAKQAVVLTMTTNGIPFIFYGEEVGAMMEEGIRNVKPMLWDNTEGTAGYTTNEEPWSPVGNNQDPHNVAYQYKKPGSLWSHYQKMIDLRGSYSTLSHGEYEFFKGNKDLLVFAKRFENEAILVIMNTSDTDQKVMDKRFYNTYDNLMDDGTFKLDENTVIRPKEFLLLR